MGDRVQFFFSACACLPFRYFSPFRATKQTRNMDGPPLFSFFASKIRAASVLGCWRDVVAWLPRTDGRMVPTAPLFYSPRSDFFLGLGLVRAGLGWGWCERSGACGGAWGRRGRVARVQITTEPGHRIHHRLHRVHFGAAPPSRCCPAYPRRINFAFRSVLPRRYLSRRR
jgi:hypothetical protein